MEHPESMLVPTSVAEGLAVEIGKSHCCKDSFCEHGKFRLQAAVVFRRRARRSVLTRVFEERSILKLSGRFPTFISVMSNCCKKDAEQVCTPADIAV